MSTRKEWVVDEKGFHAKSVWESMPSDKTAVDSVESEAPAKQETSPYAKIVLHGVELIPGPDGLAFNKKFSARATVDVKDKTVNKRVTFRLFCIYKGTDYEIKPPVEGVIHDTVAEAEMTLYYGDKEDGCTYYEDSFNDPELTCEYIVKASHPATSEIKESEPVTMPQKKSDEKPYGGYELKKGDNDNKKIWGGEKRDVEGSFTAELQEDLFALGYWITDGLKVYDPMVYDGDFGNGTYSGLKTFQYEHKDSYKLEVTGKLDKKSAEVIKECISNNSFKRPGIKIDQNDIDDNYCKYAKEKPAKPERYYQLPPSVDGGYKRYGECKCSTGGKLGDVYHNDIWGSKVTIDAIISLAQKWKSENDTLEIGDISRWDVKKFSAHSSHLAGYSVDIRSDKVGAMQKGGSDNKSFDKDKSVKFAKMAIALGFKYIITKCPHVAAECNKKAKDENLKMYVNLYDNHHHHFHMDFWKSGYKYSFDKDNYSDRAYCNSCILKDSCDSDKNITKNKDKKDDKKEDKEKDNDKI